MSPVYLLPTINTLFMYTNPNRCTGIKQPVTTIVLF